MSREKAQKGRKKIDILMYLLFFVIFVSFRGQSHLRSHHVMIERPVFETRSSPREARWR